MQTIIDFIGSLPPLLQLLAGVFGTLAIIKTLMIVVDFIEDRREGKG
ncbi:MAG: hypothetical protein G3M78_02340 [Candidatus Nitrohelix vancouverensis]|uniref:Uncharacterized protein n=1 Tax=Candidatus Nitrohelix vancouverensis TaxID=2705534 RepID=A0A7T0G2F6_9BACT|nr:MAG: hypothetical protein G3M78_02340 [Candidatus Nitrohelix vancouverensis]